MNPRRIPAVYMRGGTSKGVFFHVRDLPRSMRERDALLLRVIGSPDPYGKHTDGMGGATSSTSKVVLVAPSTRDGCDVDFLFGAVSIGAPLIDWSGNCGNLSAAVGPFAIAEGLVAPVDGLTRVRIWQQNIGQRIDAFVPVRHSEVLEDGAFMEDGVPFPGAEIRLEFLEPQPEARGDASGVEALPLLPTGSPQDELAVPGLGRIRATMITAGNPTVFVRADALGLTGRELPDEINRQRKLLAQLEAIRAAAAVRMGLADSAEFATAFRPAPPHVARVGRPGGDRPPPRGDVGAHPHARRGRGSCRGAPAPARARRPPPTASTCWRGSCRWASCITRSPVPGRSRWRRPRRCPAPSSARSPGRCPGCRHGSATSPACWRWAPRCRPGPSAGASTRRCCRAARVA